MEQLKIKDSFYFWGEINRGYFLLGFELTKRALKQQFLESGVEIHLKPMPLQDCVSWAFRRNHEISVQSWRLTIYKFLKSQIVNFYWLIDFETKTSFLTKRHVLGTMMILAFDEEKPHYLICGFFQVFECLVVKSKRHVIGIADSA